MNKVINQETNIGLASKAKNLVKGIKTPVLALAIVMSLSGCGKQEEQEITSDSKIDDYDYAINVDSSFRFTDVNYEKELDRRVEEIYSSISSSGDEIFTKEQIKKMILFANYYQLNDKPEYETLIEIQKIADNIGLCSSFMDVTSFLTTNNVDYEMISEYQFYVNMLYSDNISIEEKINYTKKLNELTARIFIGNYETYRDATASGLQIVTSMYNGAGDIIDDLSAGRNWGPIYGDDEEIDGTYGSICVEELRKFMEDNREVDSFTNQVTATEILLTEEEALAYASNHEMDNHGNRVEIPPISETKERALMKVLQLENDYNYYQDIYGNIYEIAPINETKQRVRK